MAKKKDNTNTQDTQEGDSTPLKNNKLKPKDKGVRQLKKFYTLDDVKASEKVRKTTTMRQVVLDILEVMHNNSLTLDDHDFTRDVENFILEKAVKQGVLVFEEDHNPEQNLIKIKTGIENKIEGLYKDLGDYRNYLFSQLQAVQDRINSPLPNYNQHDTDKLHATAI